VTTAHQKQLRKGQTLASRREKTPFWGDKRSRGKNGNKKRRAAPKYNYCLNKKTDTREKDFNLHLNADGGGIQTFKKSA